jgi:hypothetical protein
MLVSGNLSEYLQSMPCLKAFIIPAESCIFKWNGYRHVLKRKPYEKSNNNKAV